MLGRCSSLYSPDLLFLPMYQHIMLYFRPYRTTKCTPCTPRTLINNPNIFFFSAPSTTAHELIYSYSFHLLDLLVLADSHLLPPPADIFFCIRSWTPPPPRQSFCPVNKRWRLCSHCLWNKVRKKWLCCLYSTMLILNGLSKVPVHFCVCERCSSWPNVEYWVVHQNWSTQATRPPLLLLLLRVLGSQQASSLDSLIGNTSCDITDWGTATSAAFKQQQFLIVLQCRLTRSWWK